jgi:ABC-2 type transport system permease protein
MRKVLVIASREYQAAVRTKAFVISLLVLPVMMGGSALVQILTHDRPDTEDKKVAIIDRTGQNLYPEIAARAKARTEPPSFLLEHVQPSPLNGEAEQEQRFELSERVRDKDLFSFVEISLAPPQTEPAAGNPVPKPRPAGTVAAETYVVRYQSNSPINDVVQHWIQKTVKEIQIQRFEAANPGVAPRDIQVLRGEVALDAKGLSKRNADGKIEEAPPENKVASFLIPLGLMMLMFMMILLGATPLMQGVVEEKMQRIAEVLLGSVQPFALMMGKLLGMVAVSLTLSAVYLGGAYYAAWQYHYLDFLPTELLIWFVVYQALAVLMYGSLFIAVGAACTDLRETQAMMWPVMLLAMFPMFVWTVVIREPNSTFSTVASLFPFSAPMLMIIRQAVPPGIPTWQPVLGVVLVLAMTTVCVYVAGRIFRVGILLQGKGAHVSELVKWVFKG